jgi:hypothetical protein
MQAAMCDAAAAYGSLIVFDAMHTCSKASPSAR